MQSTPRARRVTPFLVMEVLERAQEIQAAGHDVIYLNIGEPDFDTPQAVKDAACRALAENKTHYTHSQGVIELREAICEHYAERYDVEITPERIVVTSGTSPAMLVAFAALLEPGDNCILSDPGYPCYANFIEFVDGEARRVRVREEDGFQYRARDIAAAMDERTKAILINSPANPTGTLLPPERMQAVAELGPAVVSDEIYHGLTYAGEERTILEYSDQAFVLNGFSKLYAMTGWRLGYLIAPKDAVRNIQKMSQNFFISAGSVAQWAALAALKETAEDVARMRAIYDARRKVLLEGLERIGFRVGTEPTGAFYVLANARAFTRDSLAFAFEILERAHVAVAPGIDFGPGAEGYIRFSYANSQENIQEGLDRLGRFLRSR
jgi:aspartate/methionine/tyrosine aminotransferase